MKSTHPDDSSLARLIGILETHNPNLLQLLRATTEEEFLAAAEGALERVIRTIEAGAKGYGSLKEPGLSRLLVDLLNLAGFHATAESDHMGHVDVMIEHAFGGRWKYLGECKIWGGFKYHVKGCRQLLGYCSGREPRAFLLGFFKCPGMYGKLEDLRRQFDREKPAEQCGASSDHTARGAFITEHLHRSGRCIELLHLGCTVWVSDRPMPTV